MRTTFIVWAAQAVLDAKGVQSPLYLQRRRGMRQTL